MVVSLNLSDRYVQNWGVWEIAREIICNAIDSGSEYSVTPFGNDKLVIESKSIPNIADLFIIGGGTKQEGGDTIGQFGEGFKLAALAATRIGEISCRLGNQHIGFMFQDVLGSRVLHAECLDCDHQDSFVVTINAPSVGSVVDGRFVDKNLSIVPDAEPGTIYCKGVYICNIPGLVCAWNINDLKLNRDRSIPDRFNLECSIASVISSSKSLIKKFIPLEESVEHSTFTKTWYFCGSVVADCVRELKGQDVFIVTDLDASSSVSKKTKRPYYVPSKSLERLIAGEIETDIDIVSKERKQQKTLVATVMYSKQINWLYSFNGSAGIPTFPIEIYENEDELSMGEADIEKKVIRLNERLFTNGSQSDLVATYLHEAAHIISGAYDCTYEFEHALTNIIGRIAMKSAEVA